MKRKTGYFLLLFFLAMNVWATSRLAFADERITNSGDVEEGTLVQKKIKVRIQDEKGEKISLAHVAIRGLSWITCSNDEGHIEIDPELLSVDTEFEISHLGFAFCRITWGDIKKNGYSIRMTTQVLELNEVVILPDEVMRKKGMKMWRKVLDCWDANQLSESYMLNVHNLILEHENDSLIYFHESNGQIFRFGYTPPLCRILSQSYKSGNDFLRLFRVRESLPARKGDYLFFILGYPYHFMVQEYFVIRKRNPEVYYYEENENHFYLELRYKLSTEDYGQLNVWGDRRDYTLQKVENMEHVVIEQEQKIDALVQEIWKYGKKGGHIYPLSYSGEMIRYQRDAKGYEWLGKRYQYAEFTDCTEATDNDYELFFESQTALRNKPDYKNLLHKDYSFWATADYREEDWKQVSLPVNLMSDAIRLKKEFPMNGQHRWQYENGRYE